MTEWILFIFFPFFFNGKKALSIFFLLFLSSERIFGSRLYFSSITFSSLFYFIFFLLPPKISLHCFNLMVRSSKNTTGSSRSVTVMARILPKSFVLQLSRDMFASPELFVNLLSVIVQ